jgi:hypothetical protein
MASDVQGLFEKWIDLLRKQTALSLDFAKDALDAVQGQTGTATLRFRVPSNLTGDSGNQNNPSISLPNTAVGNISALTNFRSAAGGLIQGGRLIAKKNPPSSDEFEFSLVNVAADTPAAGLFYGTVVNTTNNLIIAAVIIDVF